MVENIFLHVDGNQNTIKSHVFKSTLFSNFHLKILVFSVLSLINLASKTITTCSKHMICISAIRTIQSKKVNRNIFSLKSKENKNVQPGHFNYTFL